MQNPSPLAPAPEIVLCVAAHPDDIDFYAGGTVSAFARQGAAVYYLILTDGGSGTERRSVNREKLRDARRNEQRLAGSRLGVKDIFFRNFTDGGLENTLEIKREIVKVIRQVKPDLVITMDPSALYSAAQGVINHPDHRAAGQATLDAVYPLARDHMTFPELLDQGYEPHITSTVLLIHFDKHNFAVDITDTIEAKLQSLDAHVSQNGLQKIKPEVRKTAMTAGKPYGYAFAEAFIRIDIR